MGWRVLLSDFIHFPNIISNEVELGVSGEVRILLASQKSTRTSIVTHNKPNNNALVQQQVFLLGRFCV